MAITKHSSIHPLSDNEKTFVIVDLPHDNEDETDQERKHQLPITFTPPQSRAAPKRYVSQESLTPSAVEQIMTGDNFGLAGQRAYEAAMWCGLGCFFVCGLVLLVGGIYHII